MTPVMTTPAMKVELWSARDQKEGRRPRPATPSSAAARSNDDAHLSLILGSRRAVTRSVKKITMTTPSA